MFDIFRSPQIKALLNKLFIYALIIYVFVILGRSVWINFQLNKQINTIEQEISALQEENKNLENLILYYQSDSFREVEARAKLGLKKPGETAVAVSTKKYDNYQAEIEDQKANIVTKNQDEIAPNWKNWWNYFFK